MTATALHVQIIDNLTGSVLADVDARSTAHALAYYLTSRHIDPAATEGSVREGTNTDPLDADWFTRTLVREERGIRTGNLLSSIFARVTPNHCEYCRKVLGS